MSRHYSHHARLDCNYMTWSSEFQEKEAQKRLKHTRNLFRLQIKGA